MVKMHYPFALYDQEGKEVVGRDLYASTYQVYRQEILQHNTASVLM